MAARNKWIWGISGTTKYAVKDLTEIQLVENSVKQNFQVVARKRTGWEKVLLKEYSEKNKAQKFINETFKSV
jgi:hypothetical protein